MSDEEIQKLREKYVLEYHEQEEESIVIDIPKSKTEYYFLLKEVEEILKSILRKRLYKKYSQVIVSIQYE